MIKAMVCLLALGWVAGCTTPGGGVSGGGQVLHVRWQRLVDEKGQTCARCGATEQAAAEGVKKLGRCLKPLGVKVVLEKTALSVAEFTKDPLQSNRIWIGEKPIEEWLRAEVGKSQCCGACGDSECRTLTVDGKTYEAVSAELIVRAGLLAGAEWMANQARNPWNPMEGWSKGSPECGPATPGGTKR